MADAVGEGETDILLHGSQARKLMTNEKGSNVLFEVASKNCSTGWPKGYIPNPHSEKTEGAERPPKWLDAMNERHALEAKAVLGQKEKAGADGQVASLSRKLQRRQQRVT